jgi:hypothetical protein
LTLNPFLLLLTSALLPLLLQRFLLGALALLPGLSRFERSNRRSLRRPWFFDFLRQALLASLFFPDSSIGIRGDTDARR